MPLIASISACECSVGKSGRNFLSSNSTGVCSRERSSCKSGVGGETGLPKRSWCGKRGNAPVLTTGGGVTDPRSSISPGVGGVSTLSSTISILLTGDEQPSSSGNEENPSETDSKLGGEGDCWVLACCGKDRLCLSKFLSGEDKGCFRALFFLFPGSCEDADQQPLRDPDHDPALSFDSGEEDERLRFIF